MKTKFIKSVTYAEREYKAGDIVDVPEGDFYFLLSLGLVEPLPEGESLNCKCVNCGFDSWKRAKPKGNTLITCLNCGHSELHIDYKRPSFDELRGNKHER